MEPIPMLTLDKHYSDSVNRIKSLRTRKKISAYESDVLIKCFTRAYAYSVADEIIKDFSDEIDKYLSSSVIDIL